MDDDSSVPTGQHAHPGGHACPSCGRIEPVAGARFCGTCGTALRVDVYEAHPARVGHAVLPAVPGAAVGHLAPIAPASVPARTTYAVPRIGSLALARVGGIVGGLFSLPLCLVFAFLGTSAVHAVRTVLDGWVRQELRVPIVNAGLSMNFVRLLGLEGPHGFFSYWDDRLVMLFAILWLVPWGLAILGAALFAALLALIYNLFGRLGGGAEVELVARR
jgi:hypothetical protein